MTSMFSTALMGLFLLSNVSTTTISALDWTTESPEAPKYKTIETYSVGMSGYNAVPEQTDESPNVTASGTAPIPDVTAARSRDLADELPFGTVIEIVPTDGPFSTSCGLSVVGENIGLRVITDTMHQRKKNQVDILFNTDDIVRVGTRRLNPAVAFGICKNVDIRVVGKVDMARLPKTQMALRTLIKKASLALGQ